MNSHKKFAIAYLIFTFISCGFPNEASKPCITIPEKIMQLGYQETYQEAQWLIYKFNLMESDSFVVNNPFYQDSIYHQHSLSEFELDFIRLTQIDDTTAFHFIFEKGASPKNIHGYSDIAFWPTGGNKIGLGLFGSRYGFVVNKHDFSNEFAQYLHKNKNRLSPTLKCLAIEKGVFKK